MKSVKRVIRWSVAVLLLALVAIAVLFECAPSCGATRFLDGHVGKYYRSARVGTIDLWYKVRRVTFGTPIPAKPEAEEDSSAPAKAVPAPTSASTFSQATWYSRKRVSDSDCRGKIVLVCVWNADVQDSVDVLPRIQQLAEGFSDKPLVVVLSHRGASAEKAKAALSKSGVTLPACEAAGLANEPHAPGSYPFIYVVDHKGKVRYRGRSDRPATEALVNAFTDYVLKK